MKSRFCVNQGGRVLYGKVSLQLYLKGLHQVFFPETIIKFFRQLFVSKTHVSEGKGT